MQQIGAHRFEDIHILSDHVQVRIVLGAKHKRDWSLCQLQQTHKIVFWSLLSIVLTAEQRGKHVKNPFMMTIRIRAWCCSSGLKTETPPVCA